MEVPKTPQIKAYKRKRQQQQQQQENTKSGGGGGGASGAPRTRSQVAPDWTTKESLILVNEIVAIERDCSNSLASYQKWKIVVENCMGMDVGRPLNQCRSKWNSLLAEYNAVKQWHCKPGADSYWSLPSGRRAELGLPEDLDEELFKNIDNYVKAKMDQLDTDPDTDREADNDLLDAIAKLGHKKQKRSKARAGEKLQKCSAIANPQVTHAKEEPPRDKMEEKPPISCEDKIPVTVILIDEEPEKTKVEEKPQILLASDVPQANPQKIHVEEKPEKSDMQGKSKSNSPQKKKVSVAAQNKQMILDKLSKSAEMIHLIVEGKLPETAGLETGEWRNAEDLQDYLVQRQGDKLIAHLAEIVNICKEYMCPQV